MQTSVKNKRRKYDSNFKAEVLKMLTNGQSVSYISKALGIGESLIYEWKNTAGIKTTVKPVEPSSSELMLSLASENELLKQQLKQIEIERDILKKALVIFSKVS